MKYIEVGVGTDVAIAFLKYKPLLAILSSVGVVFL